MSEKKLSKFWCVDVRRFDGNGIKVLLYSVMAQYLPEHEDVPNKLCQQTRDYYITYNEAKFVKKTLEEAYSYVKTN